MLLKGLRLKDALKHEREQLGLSRDKLSKLADINPQTIYRAETTGKITLENYIKITQTLEQYASTNNANGVSDNANSSL